jgi:uncharacterized protein YkwD
MRKALTIVLLTLAACVPAFTLAAALAPATAEATVTPTRVERRVLAAINREREAAGLAKLGFKPSLIRAARAHTRDIAARGVLTHTSDDGSTVVQRVRDFGYRSSGYTSWKVGETLAAGTAGTAVATPAAIVALWMGSPGHRDVLMTPGFRDVGVGVVRGDDGMRYFTVDFGRRIY